LVWIQIKTRGGKLGRKLGRKLDRKLGRKLGSSSRKGPTKM
jgi:hypothetical protein